MRLFSKIFATVWRRVYCGTASTTLSKLDILLCLFPDFGWLRCMETALHKFKIELYRNCERRLIWREQKSF
jgi:hypothetical protein